MHSKTLLLLIVGVAPSLQFGVAPLLTIPPGNSDTYVNPNHANDHRLDVNDWVEGAPGVMNAIAIRHALDALIGYNIVLPVWEFYEKQGGNLNYHTNNFGVVELTDY